MINDFDFFFNNAWKKAAEFGKKAADGAKNIVEQTKENIHEQQAKKYISINKKDFKSKDFKLPNIVKIEDDQITCQGLSKNNTTPDAPITQDMIYGQVVGSWKDFGPFKKFISSLLVNFIKSLESYLLNAFLFGTSHMEIGTPTSVTYVDFNRIPK